MRKRQTLTAELLRELVDYDPATGLFVWKQKRRGQVVPGSIAGHIDKDGYRIFMLAGVSYRAHRVAWFWCHGTFPKQELDHINGNKDDNRVANLREANKSENQQNLACARVTNGTGLLGAHKSHTMFEARIKLNGITRRLGRFKTPEEAHLEYLRVKQNIHTHNERALANASI